jgi:BirA family biotin operon repressor/biotin-[acetyl-CoA-carboxylase] ligase
MRERVLSLLIQHLGRSVSGEELASLLGVSRTAVWKQVRALRRLGVEIEVDRRGYRLLRMPDLLMESEIRAKLSTRRFGRRLHLHQRVTSTNDLAKELARSGEEEGSVVVAEEQTRGRGRVGRSWLSPRGGLWFSLILRPSIAPQEAPRITLIFGAAVAKTLRRLYHVDANIKWPNDVLIREKKVCGILTEVEAELDVLTFLVAGVGINANNSTEAFPEEIREGATSLKEELGRSVDRNELLAELLNEFERSYEVFLKSGRGSLMIDWQDLCSTLGRRVRILTPRATIEGEAVGIDEEGALLVRTREGERRRVLYGECIHLR